MSGGETVELRYPLLVDGAELRVVRLRRITVGDLELVEAERNNLSKSVRLVSLAAELAPDTVRRLDAADFNVLSERVAGFLE
jgi:hypothetical protein